MMRMGHGKRSLTVEDVVARAGQKYLTMYQTNTGLPASDKEDFISHIGMVSEPPFNLTVAQYIDRVHRFGPLWITTDSADGRLFAPHARILIRITGTGTPDGVGTNFPFINPATGAESTESFTDFHRAFEQMVTDNRSTRLFVQVVHFADELGTATEGYQIRGKIHSPIHENMTLAALIKSTVAVPAANVVGE